MSYKIIIETTSSRKRAQSHINALKNMNITGFIETLNLDHQTLYSVQAGPYDYKKDALVNVDKIKRLGVRNAFITSAEL